MVGDDIKEKPLAESSMKEDTKQLETDYEPPEHQNGGMLANSRKGPNKDIMIIEEIEGLMNQAMRKIGDINDNVGTRALRAKSFEEIDLFQKTTLFELRKAFE